MKTHPLFYQKPRRPLILLLALLSWCACSKGIDPLDHADYIRFVKAEPWSGRLETAIVTFKNEKGVSLDLIAAVHLGDKDYYDGLNFLFKKYDALLYELVTPEEKPRNASSQMDLSFVGNIQRNLCNILGLDYQLWTIDYGASNFVHADLTLERFSDLLKEKEESIWTLLLKSLTAQAQAAAIGSGSTLTPEAVLDALRSKDRRSRLKYLLGQEFGNIENMLAMLDPGEDGDESVLLGERNKAALRAMEAEISRGKKKLALFYGAGHMPDLEFRLKRDHGFHPTRTRWLTAWDIRAAKE